MQVGDKSSVREKLRVKRADCGGWGIGGTVKNHKSEAGDLVPVRKGRVEEA
jgi:hypothetical protein